MQEREFYGVRNGYVFSLFEIVVVVVVVLKISQSLHYNLF